MNDAQRALEALAARFLEELPNRLQAVRDDLDALRHGAGDWGEAHRRIHSLVGAAGTFGLATVSERARELERLAKAVAVAGQVPDWEALEAAFAALRQADGEGGPPGRPSAEFVPLSRPAHILVAEDDAVTRRVLVARLEQAGHRVVAVEDGLSALEVLAAPRRPDLVLMDVMMPVLDGLQAVRSLRADERRLGLPHLPVIFLTADEDPALLQEAIRLGGDDLLVKPASPVLLDAKIRALQRLAELNQTLARYHRETERELSLAERVMSVSLSRNDRDFPGLSWRCRPAGRFSGDALFCRRRDEVGYVLLADFTGHGLPASVGTLIAAEVFHPLAAEGRPGEAILAALNDRLGELLPTDIFCAACLVQVQGRRLRVWNRGLPEAWWLQEGSAPRPLPSAFLPLGVVRGADFDTRPETLDLTPGSRLLVYTDGLSEARSAAGSPLGTAAVASAAGGGLAAVEGLLERHLDGRAPEDDVTIAHLDLDPWL